MQSDKAAVEITSRFDGTVKSLKYSVGDVAKVGSPLMEIDVDEEDGVRSEGTPASSTEKPASEPTPVTPATVNSTPITTTSTAPSSSPSNTQGHADTNSTLATPAVRRVAKEFNVNLGLVTGSGPQGRVLKGDVLDFIAAKGSLFTVHLQR